MYDGLNTKIDTIFSLGPSKIKNYQCIIRYMTY